MIKYLQFVLPGFVSKKIYKHLSTPRKRKIAEHEVKILIAANTKLLDYNGFTLMRYEWGKNKNKTAFLVHGWEGQTGNFASLISNLVETGYRVVSIDAPSHGSSSNGKTNMFEFSKILISHFKKEMPEVVISHSFGSVNVARVLRFSPEVFVKSWFLVTTPNNFKSRINEMAVKFGLNQMVLKKLISRIEFDVDENINNLNMVEYCSQLKNVEKAVIIHSKTDKVLPINGAREVSKSFKKSELVELDNYGHYSILWSDELKSILKNQLEVHV